MKVNHYECDECGRKVRRITVHLDGMFHDHFEAQELHFCSTTCMTDHLAETSADISSVWDYWLAGHDLRDGA